MRSKVYTIPRPRFTRVASEHYLRRMWPIFLAFPLFGICAMILGPNQLVKVIGFFAFLWPFSIPARVAIAGWTKAKQLSRETWVLLEDGVLYFHDDDGGGMKLPLAQVRRMDVRSGYFVLETKNFNFALIPQDAFDEPVVFADEVAKAL